MSQRESELIRYGSLMMEGATRRNIMDAQLASVLCVLQAQNNAYLHPKWVETIQHESLPYKELHWDSNRQSDFSELFDPVKLTASLHAQLYMIGSDERSLLPIFLPLSNDTRMDPMTRDLAYEFAAISKSLKPTISFSFDSTSRLPESAIYRTNQIYKGVEEFLGRYIEILHDHMAKPWRPDASPMIGSLPFNADVLAVQSVEKENQEALLRNSVFMSTAYGDMSRKIYYTIRQKSQTQEERDLLRAQFDFPGYVFDPAYFHTKRQYVSVADLVFGRDHSIVQESMLQAIHRDLTQHFDNRIVPIYESMSKLDHTQVNVIQSLSRLARFSLLSVQYAQEERISRLLEEKN